VYEKKRFDILLEATTPIAHHQEVFGNAAVIMRRKVRLEDGSFAQVPIITGDTMRHGLREAAAYAYLDAAGMLDAGALTEAALRLLFAGGMVTGRGDASVSRLDDYREMCELVPPLGLLGGCAGSRVIPGRLIVDDAIVVCEETRRHCSPWMLDRAGEMSGARAHVETHQRVRMDPLLDPGKRKLLSGDASHQIEAKLRRSDNAHVDASATEAEASKSTMMPRTFETISAGSLLSWHVEATLMSELERDTFHAMVAAFLGNARVGGKRGTGFGAIRAVAANEVVLQRPAETMHAVDVTAFGPAVGQLFRDHVRAHAEKARTFLSKVDA
jgi:hypothetical protein